jgi:hypothetical protein
VLPDEGIYAVAGMSAAQQTYRPQNLDQGLSCQPSYTRLINKSRGGKPLTSDERRGTVSRRGARLRSPIRFTIASA